MMSSTSKPLFPLLLLLAFAATGALAQGSDTDPRAAVPGYLSAVGIGVSDLERSTDFYMRVLGMQKVTTYELDTMDEVVLSYPGRGGSVIVLMHWTDGSARSYKDNPIKLVFRVDDPKAFAERIRADGGEIVREPTPVPTLGNAIVGFAKDPDGYLIEILQAPGQ
jgi:lactoylglutathione lyase